MVKYNGSKEQKQDLKKKQREQKQDNCNKKKVIDH